jgi:hypothetical protein
MITETETTLGVADSLRLMEKVVNAKGEDYVYADGDADTKCTYSYEGQPSCLVGFVLFLAGATVAELAALDRDGSTSLVMLHYDGVLPVRLTDDAAAVLQRAQEAQDSGRTWGTSLAWARGLAGALERAAA